MYDKSTLLKGTGASLAVVAVLAIVIVSTGTAYAVPMAGVGGFTIQADEIRGEEAFIYADTADTSEQEQIPVAVTEVQSMEIDGLYLNKTMQLPGLDGTVKMTVEATDTVTTGQQVVKYSHLDTSSTTVRGQVVDEHPPSSDKPGFTIEGRGDAYDGYTVDINETSDEPGLVLENATINAHYLATSKITLPGQKIIISWDQDGDGEYEQVFGE